MLKPNSLLPDTETSDPEQQFQLLDMLGQGAYGSVSKALHKKTGSLFAIKILSATSLSEINSIKKEIQILKLCDNEHIVKYYGSYFKDNNLWIVLEYCHAGSIIDLLNITQKKLNQYEIASILESVLMGLVYLHQNKKIHRDIKAANILLNKEGVAKLADFGVSAESMYTNAGHKSQVGSPYWMSPEVMKHSQYTNKTDIWSLGVTAIELAEGVVPNSHLKPLIAMWQLKDKPIQQFKDPTKWSKQFNNFVKDCLNVNPSQRPEAKALLHHQFITRYSKGQNLLAQLVQQSLADIEQFRLGQQKSQDSQQDLRNILNDSNLGQQTKTIVHNPTSRSRQQYPSDKFPSREQQQLQNLQSSMIINQNSINGSMIVNQIDSSMIVVDTEANHKQKPVNFLHKYISGLKNSQNQIDLKKEQLKKRIVDYDEVCLKQVEGIFVKYKNMINDILVEGLSQQFFGMDTNFIKNQFKSKLLGSENVKDFLISHPKYKEIKEVKQIEKPQMNKKKSEFSEMAHHSTQTNDPDYTDIGQFRQAYPRGVKSQQFNERQFRTGEKQHCFNSNSIISDIQNVKYKNQRQINKRLIVTQPHEWIPIDRKPFHCQNNLMNTDKTKLKQFLMDPDVKESLMNHMQSVSRYPDRNIEEPNTIKYDRIAENNLFDFQDQGLKHQNSVTIVRSKDFNRNHYSQQEYLLLNEEYDQDQTQININLFNAKNNSAKLSKIVDLNKKEKDKKNSKIVKRQGTSSQKRGIQTKNNYASGKSKISKEGK